MQSRSFRRGARTIGLVLATAVVIAIPVSLVAKDILGTEKKLYSQLDEELVIRDFFQDRRDGYFLDIGCADPESGSTTYYLEKHLGWSGIAIDARNELRPLWKKKRPKSTFVTYLITDHSDTTDPFYVIKGAEGLSSTEKERQFYGKTYEGEERKVLSITLNDLLTKYKVTTVDFVNLDIEGAELLALAGFDINRYKPELLCVEASPHHRDKIVSWFADHGYEQIDKYLEYDKVNLYFRQKGSGSR